MGSRQESHDEPVVADHRSARRPRAGADGRGAAPRRRGVQAAGLPRRRRERPRRRLDRPIAASSSAASRAACPARCRRRPTTTTIASCRARATSRFRSRCSAARASSRPTAARTSASALRQYMGDSRGHWEGNTLVVETTNFTNRTLYRGAAENLKLVERFTRRRAGHARLPSSRRSIRRRSRGRGRRRSRICAPTSRCSSMRATKGNYGMEGILSGARVEEAKPPGRRSTCDE